MNMQDTFNKAYIGMSKQNWEQCVLDDCPSYRSNNMKCIAGHLIPDEIYNVDMEGHSTNRPKMIKLWDSLGMDYKTKSMINVMQVIHDNNKKPKDMKNAMEKLAFDLELTIPKN